MEYAVRFLLGGALVSAFSLLGEIWRPKTFAGLFGAAPSVAIATLTLGYFAHGVAYTRVEARSMLIGTIAMLIYTTACVVFIRRERVPVLASVTVATLGWLGAALFCHAVLG